MRRRIGAALAGVLLAAAVAGPAGASSTAGGSGGGAPAGEDFITVTDTTTLDATPTVTTTDETRSYDLGAHDAATNEPVGGAPTSLPQSNSQVFTGGTPTEAGCLTHVVTVQYVTVYLWFHLTHWEYHEQTHECWHWKSWHRVDYTGCGNPCQPPTTFGWWDHVEGPGLWDIQGQCNGINNGTGTTTTCQDWPFTFEAGYAYSGHVILQRAEIDACLTPGCTISDPWFARAQFDPHDNGQWVSYGDVQ